MSGPVRPEITEPDPLAGLAVIDRLEVGPLRLEPQRLICPYRAVQQDGEQSTELIYRYQEPVFDPDDAACLNLAAMIAAQPALNYGLFSRELVFHGPYDPHDRAFLREMARNTAREIYVNKFLQPNPFINLSHRNLPAHKLPSYLRARLRFPQKTGSQSGDAWPSGNEGCTVLSSGGKESLLGFAALREIGSPVRPVFINESGRHWFTALNAFRHFCGQVPATARVWTNVDRLYNWMLRRLPFIRPDFASLRSDMYPIRLWTVAVLIFATLPLMRQSGSRRLVVGDEFDTTVRAKHRGISHYDGLYDQSIFFDRALSRYFFQKGWRVSQFSILRPLSELLIEKILVERYPELQRQQVSCHAAHTAGGEVRPCGRCEKCRRIVGMLLALGTDPAGCGYSQEQVEKCLRDWQSKGVHQEEAGVRQAMFMLGQRGLVPSRQGGAGPKGPHPEIMQLRFDPLRSPMSGIPRDLRRPLYGIFLQHAKGAVFRTGKVWVARNPFKTPELDQPYEFGNVQTNGMQEAYEGTSAMPSYILGELTWPQAKRRFKEVDLALLPVGAIEQHGPHLPLDLDAFDAKHLTLEVAKACSPPRPLVLPLMPYGVSYHHEDFAGTLSVSPETLSKLVYEVGMAAARHGITKLVIINGHGGNVPALNFAAQMINRDARIFTCVESGETSDADIAAMVDTPNDVHAGEIETSTALALRPELVQMDQAQSQVPQFSSRYLDFATKRSVTWYAHTARLSPSGVLGDPAKATAEKGERVWEVMIRRLVEFVEHIKGLTLQEIHQRRY